MSKWMERFGLDRMGQTDKQTEIIDIEARFSCKMVIKTVESVYHSNELIGKAEHATDKIFISLTTQTRHQRKHSAVSSSACGVSLTMTYGSSAIVTDDDDVSATATDACVFSSALLRETVSVKKRNTNGRLGALVQEQQWENLREQLALVSSIAIEIARRERKLVTWMEL